MTALRPGTSPPPVRMPRRFIAMPTPYNSMVQNVQNSRPFPSTGRAPSPAVSHHRQLSQRYQASAPCRVTSVGCHPPHELAARPFVPVLAVLAALRRRPVVTLAHVAPTKNRCLALLEARSANSQLISQRARQCVGRGGLTHGVYRR